MDTTTTTLLGTTLRVKLFFVTRSRNLVLEKNGYKAPKAMSTGTTIVGIIAKVRVTLFKLKLQDCVVLGADTRATEGSIVADKNCEKIHYIAPNIYCCGAGTAAGRFLCRILINAHPQTPKTPPKK